MPRAPPSLHFFAAKANCSTRRSSSSRLKSSGGLRRRAVHALDALDAAVAELEEKFTAVPVHAVAGAAEKGLVRRLVQHGLARVGTLHLVDAEMAGDDKAHFVFTSSMSVSAQSGVT